MLVKALTWYHKNQIQDYTGHMRPVAISAMLKKAADAVFKPPGGDGKLAA